MVTSYRGESNLDIVIEASHGKNREKNVSNQRDRNAKVLRQTAWYTKGAERLIHLEEWGKEKVVQAEDNLYSSTVCWVPHMQASLYRSTWRAGVLSQMS